MWMEYEEFVEAVQKRMEKEMGERGSVFISSMEKTTAPIGKDWRSKKKKYGWVRYFS